MSYGPPQAGFPGAPPHSYSPQPGFGPPPGQYPPPNSFPQQGGFPPGPPPGQFQGGYGAPPPQGFPPQGFPPQGYPPQNYGPPAFPSPGYDINAPLPPGDPSRDADALRAAMKGFGTNERVLIQILSKPDPMQMRALVHCFNHRLGRNLEKDIKSETSGDFEDGLLALIRGPLDQDVYLLNKALKGLGTKESLLNDVLCGRSNADMNAIKFRYRQTIGRDLLNDVKGDLSLKTETLFTMILAANRAEESSPYDPMGIDRDVMDLHRAMGGRVGTDQLAVCSILTSRSNNQIRGIAHSFQQKFQTPLTKSIEREFSGHMKDALVLIVGRAVDPAMTEAELLEASMAGLGTRETLLINRVVRAHWNRQHMDQVKRAYQHRYKRDLIQRVRGEVRSHLEQLLVACLV